MALIVQKFGGSSVADLSKMRLAAGIITRAYARGDDVVAVLSAQADTTDRLLEKAGQISPAPCERELDMLLSTGEVVSVALMAMLIRSMGFPVVSLTGWQSGILTDETHTAARILTVDDGRIRRELEKRNIVLVAGFQGVDRQGDVTTLGRGGSDTTAAALAACLKADACQIYTDVDGVYTADPRRQPDARRRETVDYEQMRTLAADGAKVLHSRSVEIGKQYQVPIQVLSTFSSDGGTWIREEGPLEAARIVGVTREAAVAQVRAEASGSGAELAGVLLKNGIVPDLMRCGPAAEGRWAAEFTVPAAQAAKCRGLLEAHREALGLLSVIVREDVCRVSVVGSGLTEDPSAAAGALEALEQAGIPVRDLQLSGVRLAALGPEADGVRAGEILHRWLFV